MSSFAFAPPQTLWQTSRIEYCPPNNREDRGQSQSLDVLEVVIHNFANLSPHQQTTQCFKTPEILYKQRRWNVTLNPKYRYGFGGDCAIIQLALLGNWENFETVFAEIVILKGSALSNTFHRKLGPFMGAGYGVDRDSLLSNCVNGEGSLVIRIDINIENTTIQNNRRACWYPPSLKKHFDEIKHDLNGGRSLLDNLDGGTTIVIVVGNEKEKFRVHKCQLFLRAPGLHELVKDVPFGEIFELPNICPGVFKELYSYIYNGTPPILRNNDQWAKELLDCGDKFGCILFKLQVESEITSKYLTAKNAAEWLLIADGKACPQMKEVCMDIIKDNFEEVMASPGWKSIRESPYGRSYEDAFRLCCFRIYHQSL